MHGGKGKKKSSDEEEHEEDGEHKKAGKHYFGGNPEHGEKKAYIIRHGEEKYLQKYGPDEIYRKHIADVEGVKAKERQRERDKVLGAPEAEEDEEALGYSPMHGARPKLQGVPLYR